jgi:hypothetical protein
MSTVFDSEAVERLGETYKTSVQPEHGGSSRGGCMKAVYTGLGVLFGDRYGFRGDFHKAFFRTTAKKEKDKGLPEGRLNTIDRVFRALEEEGVALDEQTFTPRPAGQWRLADGRMIPSLEQELVGQVNALDNGSHFYGVAASGAIHSLILRFDKTDDGVTIYWMDQFSDGFDAVRPGGFVRSPEVTGILDREIRELGGNATSVWRFNAEKAVEPV